MTRAELNQKIEDINGWHYGTVHKLMDAEETADTIAEDNTRMVKALIREVMEAELMQLLHEIQDAANELPPNLLLNKVVDLVYDRKEALAQELLS